MLYTNVIYKSTVKVNGFLTNYRSVLKFKTRVSHIRAYVRRNAERLVQSILKDNEINLCVMLNGLMSSNVDYVDYVE